jgi:hypothetical protein
MCPEKQKAEQVKNRSKKHLFGEQKKNIGVIKLLD